MEIRTNNGQVMYESKFRQLHPNTSFPQVISAETLHDFGASVVFESPQVSFTRYQTAYRNGVEQIDGKWYTKYSVAEMDADAKTALDAQQAKSVRDQRDQKLKDSDWSQVADAPVDKTVWATYRQALRGCTYTKWFPLGSYLA